MAACRRCNRDARACARSSSDTRARNRAYSRMGASDPPSSAAISPSILLPRSIPRTSPTTDRSA
ncbi:Uncharacterised protein [Mycobacterium tuberculosis]|nr:Uncharacterised protein [Mycobacterium tuberculosis]